MILSSLNEISTHIKNEKTAQKYLGYIRIWLLNKKPCELCRMYYRINMKDEING